MRKLILLSLVIFTLSTAAFSSEYFEDMFKIIDNNSSSLKSSMNIFDPSNEGIREEYMTLGLDKKLDFEVFKQAVDGFKKVKKKKRNVLTIIDFSSSSSEKRFYVIDFDKNRVLYDTYVAHGKNSGNNYATEFSNSIDSNMSSLGFYLTGYTYEGSNGYSLKLYGLERDINDNAEARSIVIHGADYASPEFLRSNGHLGRSLGCPALPLEEYAKIIDELKGGSVVFIYAKDKGYQETSKYVEKEA